MHTDLKLLTAKEADPFSKSSCPENQWEAVLLRHRDRDGQRLQWWMRKVLINARNTRNAFAQVTRRSLGLSVKQKSASESFFLVNEEKKALFERQPYRSFGGPNPRQNGSAQNCTSSETLSVWNLLSLLCSPCTSEHLWVSVVSCKRVSCYSFSILAHAFCSQLASSTLSCELSRNAMNFSAQWSVKHSKNKTKAVWNWTAFQGKNLLVNCKYKEFST